MAIYQFQTFIIPKQPVQNKFGHIPKQIEIKEDKWNEYWENYDINIDNQPTFEDARTIKWWKNIDINLEMLKQKISEILPLSDWSEYSWKTNGQFDHDFDISLEDNYIKEISFRTDLRDKNGFFLKKILLFCKKNNWILMDVNGNLCNPTMKEYQEIVGKSNANKFIKNPRKFIEKLK
ncbi:MAG: hypothetical protein CSA38_04940 [Flavobacteriales bacterium]|nr:MAG: hypothetical protein CSA38_04940 [Flavobacteriales bacterium]